MPSEFIFEFDEWPRVIFSSFAGESTWHVALKLLAYLIYRQRRLSVERAVGQRYKPDLVVLRDRYVRLWIDCGETSLRKLDRVVVANPRARVVIVKDTQRRLDGYIALAAATVRAQQRIIYLAFGDGLVVDLAQALHQRNRVAFAMGPRGLRITLNGVALAGALIQRRAPAAPGRRSPSACER
jgi:uncharacterized protein YaeQ